MIMFTLLETDYFRGARLASRLTEWQHATRLDPGTFGLAEMVAVDLILKNSVTMGACEVSV